MRILLASFLVMAITGVAGAFVLLNTTGLKFMCIWLRPEGDPGWEPMTDIIVNLESNTPVMLPNNSYINIPAPYNTNRVRYLDLRCDLENSQSYVWPHIDFVSIYGLKINYNLKAEPIDSEKW